MSKNDNKQEAQAAAEERDEILEASNDESPIDMSAVPTPENTKSAGGKHIERTSKAAEDTDIIKNLATDNAGSDSEMIEDDDIAEKRTTKAGKHSAKATREAEEEVGRKEAATSNKESEAKPKIKHKPNPLKRHGKAYRDAAQLVDRTKQYDITEALDLAKKTSRVKFDASVELHANLGVDPRQADQMVRSTVILPHGTGKTVRIAVLANTDKLEEAKKAGADIVSDGDLLAKIEKGKLDFDILIATPDMMAKLSKVAKVLGPRGLMPNPKSGTVTQNIKSAVEQSKAGKVEFRIDKQAIVHLAVGKISFGTPKLEDNLKEVISSIMKAKPASTKGTYVKALSLTTSMGPGIKLDIQKAIATTQSKK